MTLIWTPSRRVAQPQVVCGFSERFPRPLALWLPPRGQQGPISVGANGVSQHGVSYNSSSYFTLATLETTVIPTGSAATIIWAIDSTLTNSANAAMCIGGSPGSFGTEEFNFYPAYTDGNAYFRWSGQINGSSAVQGSNSGVAGVYLLSVGSAGMQIWKNGFLVASNSATPSRSAGGSFLSYGQASGAPSMSTFLWITYAAQFSNATNKSLSVNPWQLFEDEQLFIPTSSGIFLPTLSGVTYTPGTLTGSGFGIRVTAS